jgi:RNA polymerase sigma-70 factor (ECF subfamily)
MKKYNLSRIMKTAWQIYRAVGMDNITFGEALKQSWAKCKELPSFEQIYKDNYKAVLNYIRFKSSNLGTENAEELCNDIFLRFKDNMYKYDGRASARTLLFTYANNGIIDHFRGKNVGKTSCMSDFADDNGKDFFQIADSNFANALVENNELSEKITKSFNVLKPKYKEVARLFFVEELQYTEIAEILEIPLGSVKGMIFRVREMLQGELKPMYNAMY